MAKRFSAAIIAGVLLMTTGCARDGRYPTTPSATEPWTSATELRPAASAPGAPVVRVAPADDVDFDGSLDDPAWKGATAYHDLGLHTGTGLLAFPTAVRFLRTGERTLWVGLECRVPPDKQGRIRSDVIDKETIEVWLDLGPSRFDFYHIMFRPDGTVQSPWVPAQTLAKGFQVKTRRRADGYSAEMRIELDALRDFGLPPGPNLGFNLARDGQGGWASLVGVVGHVHKPAQFWTLEMTGRAVEVPPVNVYRDPFRSGTDVRAAGRTIVEGWKQAPVSAHDRPWARLQVMVDALQRKLAEDEKDPWGREQELAVLAWRALTAWAAPEAGSIPMPGNIAKLRDQLAIYPGGTYPATPWREDAFVSSFDGTAQPYAIRVPAGHDPKKPLPLVLFLHGSGTTHSGSGAIFERYDADRPACIMVRVNGRQYSWFDTLASRDTLDVIDDVAGRYAVDPDRVYLTGYSAGGYGSMDLGATHPERFAAIVCVAGGLEGKSAQPLANLNVLFVHGFADPVVPPGSNAGMLALQLGCLGSPARMSMRPATGHGVVLDRFEEHLLNFRRRAVPDSVACFTDLWNPAPVRNYWVSILALADPDEPAAVHARLMSDPGPAALRVQTANVNDLALDVAEFAKAGRLRPSVLLVDGQTLAVPAGDFLRLQRHDFTWHAEGATTRPQPDPTAYRAGGITQLYAEGSPLIITPAELSDAATQLAHRSLFGTPSNWINIPVVKDTQVTEEMLRRHHLILVGGPKLNQVAARLAGLSRDWPLATDGGAVVLDSKHTYGLAEHVVEVVTFNPLNRGLRVWALLSDNPGAFAPGSPILKSRLPWKRKPDITVTSLKSNTVVESRTLQRDWTPQPQPMPGE